MVRLTPQIFRLFLWSPLVAVAFVTAGCQSVYKKINLKQSHVAAQSLEQALASTRSHGAGGRFGVYCTGLFDCQLASIDDSLIVNENTALPFASALKKNKAVSIKQNDSTIKVVGVATAGKHDVNVRFYPISMRAYEQFGFVHKFDANAVYRIHAYRKLGVLGGGDMSLLALATPKPLCVKIYKNKTAIRQFCKFSDITTGLGEFTEVAVEDDLSNSVGFVTRS